MGLSLCKEVLAIESLVFVGDSRGGLGARVLDSLDRDLPVEGSGSKEVGVVGIPTSLEGPVRDNRELSVCLSRLRVPTDCTIILS